MAHNFVKYNDGSRVCTWCGNEKGVDVDGPCAFSCAQQLQQVQQDNSGTGQNEYCSNYDMKFKMKNWGQL
jgi:hypothetical protein